MDSVTARSTLTYPVESFTVEEEARLRPHVTNLDRPVFGLVNLPETVKGALFARYSRYQGTLRRLFLDEFAEGLPEPPAAEAGEGRRAQELYERIFLGYGDDSVAQLGGAHIACEWTSNLLTKILQRPRLAAYLEQSTRYLAYDEQIEPLGYRYYRDERLGPEYVGAMDFLFDTYSRTLAEVTAWAEGRFPRGEDESPAAHTRAVRAKALDLVRGLLPAASMSHVGIYASGQTYEQLVLHLLAHPLAEARAYGELLLEELEKMIPSLTRVEGDEEQLLAACLFEASTLAEAEALAAVRALGADERSSLLAELVGERENRRHRPGRGFEALRYRFEIVSDYGAFRDLQRHRMLTCQWQQLTPHLGADVPDEVGVAGCGGDYERALERSRAEYERLRDEGLAEEAPYALCLAYRIRYVLDLNAREAMQLVELRSGREGHPSYRAVAHEVRRLISGAHPGVGAAMQWVDEDSEPRLERLLAEIRNEERAGS